MDDVLATVEVRRRRFTVEEYYRMAETGILTEKDRVELIDGEIVEMSPIGHHHATCVHALSAFLTRAVGDRALLWPQNPVRLPRDTQPQPDVVLLRPPLAQYWAAAGVPEVWIVDLTRSAVEVFRRPAEAGYRATERVARGGRLTPAAFPDVNVPVEDILPPA
jgi:Uma2 family endonuclease